MKKLNDKKNNVKKSNNKQKKTNKNVKMIVLATILSLGIAFVSLLLIFALYIIITSPDFDTDKLYKKEATVLYYNDGTEITRFGSENRVLKEYGELPQVLIDAILATEDSRFFQHTGMDVARFTKATIGQLLGNDKAGGASTITMQVIKKTYTNSNARGIKGLVRKFTDIYMAIFKLERNYTKEEIIEFYVNSMWFGNDGNLNYSGIAGVEQASNYFFGKSVSELSLAESSILAGMFQNPVKNNPYRYPENAAKRQNTVLQLMVQHGYITEEEKEAVQKIPISSLLVDRSDVTEAKANQAVVDYVIEQVEEKTGLNPYNNPMKIYTTIDPSIQDTLTKLEKGELYKFPNDALQEGLAVTSIKDGSVLGISGGRNYSAKGTNRAVDINRQPGSTAKILFDYGPYIEYLNGSTYTMFLDEDTTYSNGTPIKNSRDDHVGMITMRNALVNSRNIPALLAFQAIEKEDINYIKDFVHSLGINYGSNLYESASIGGFNGVSPVEMSAAYAAYARDGYYIEPYVFHKVELIETNEKIDHKPERKKVMSSETAYMITHMLMSATEHNVSGFKSSITDVASKGGTTTIDASQRKKLGLPNEATMDAWNITYSPDYSIALWLGYDRLSKEHYLTSNTGTPIRKAIMKAIGSKIYTKDSRFTQPSGVVEVKVELYTFPPQLASEYTPEGMYSYELFKEGTEPTEVSKRYSKLDAPTGGKYSYNGTSLTLSWNKISTPDAINQSYLQEHFNQYYGDYAGKYLDERNVYNSIYIGNIGYQVFRKESDGTLTYIGRTEGNSYTITNPPVGNTTYVIKSAYAIFQANMSDGLNIKTNTTVDSNVGDIIENPDSSSESDNNQELE